MLVLFHSRTGASARLAREAARALEALGHRAELAAITPRFELPYAAWLPLSFIPGICTPIESLEADPADFDGCLLVFPKWTFACPPVERFIALYGRKLPPAGLLVTCGGWDEGRYLEGYRRRLERLGARVAGGEAVRREQVGKPHFPALLMKILGGWVEGLVNRR